MPAFCVPDALQTEARWIGGERGALWAERLPTIVDRLSEQWRFEIGEPFDNCHVSLAMPVTLTDRSAAVCKIPMNDTEFLFAAGAARHGEPAALRWWNGTASVQLLAFDEPTGAMLLERCVPGTSLADGVAPETADEIAADLLRRLHRPPPPDASFLRLPDMAAIMAARSLERYEATGQPFERTLLDEALEMLHAARVAPENDVLLHGDTHHANILAAERQPWLAIDPLPMVGDPAYDAVQFLLFRKGDLADPETQWLPAVRHFCDVADLSAHRVLGWVFARLIGDALANLSGGLPLEKLEAHQDDLWSARLARELRAAVRPG